MEPEKGVNHHRQHEDTELMRNVNPGSWFQQ